MNFLYEFDKYPTGFFQVITPESDATGEIIFIDKEGGVRFLGVDRDCCDYLSYIDTLQPFSEFHRIETND